MNDVVREVGGTLGVAVLGSLLASAYAPGVDDAAAGLPPQAADVAGDSVGGAHHVAAQLGGEAAGRLVSAADHAFMNAMSTSMIVAAGVALMGSLVALAFLPARSRPIALPAPDNVLEVAMA
jgi:hypothetical protein